MGKTVHFKSSNRKPRTKINKISKNNDYIRRYIQFLAVCPKPSIRETVIHTAPVPVVKTFSNGSANLLRGDVQIKPSDKVKLRRIRPLINTLVDPNLSLAKKRAALEQSGRGIGLSILATAIAGIGSYFLRKLLNR